MEHNIVTWTMLVVLVVRNNVNPIRTKDDGKRCNTLRGERNNQASWCSVLLYQSNGTEISRSRFIDPFSRSTMDHTRGRVPPSASLLSLISLDASPPTPPSICAPLSYSPSYRSSPLIREIRNKNRVARQAGTSGTEELGTNGGTLRNLQLTSKTRTIVLIGLVLLTVLDTVNGIPYKRSLLRLCSKSLSDAMNLACKGRGFNEPFSYSSEDDPQDSQGPGLAEECCYHQCSYSQLQQYCKPHKASPSDAVKQPVWIEKYPYPSARPAASSSEKERSRSEIDYVHGTIKCRIHGSKGGRKKGANLDRDDDAGGCDGRNPLRRHRGGHCGCRHRRQRRRRLGKMLERTLTDRSSKNEVLTGPVSSNEGS
ncbi:Insulin-like peptide [Anthophora plagiata]